MQVHRRSPDPQRSDPCTPWPEQPHRKTRSANCHVLTSTPRRTSISPTSRRQRVKRTA